jgi:hypothetical protein
VVPKYLANLKAISEENAARFAPNLVYVGGSHLKSEGQFVGIQNQTGS